MTARKDLPPSRHGTKPVALDDFRRIARGRLARDVFAYIESGAGDEITCEANRRDLDALSFVPSCLRDVSAIDLSMKMLGRAFPVPLGFSPTAFHRLAHVDGEVATACAAKVLDVPMIVSAMSSVVLEEIASQSGHEHLWLQTYLFRDRQVTLALVRRAEEAGFKAIVVSLGCPVPGKRDRSIRCQFRLPPTVFAANFPRQDCVDYSNPIQTVVGAELDPSATWRDLAWLREITTLPLMVKGLMNPGDVAAAVELSTAGIIVSNHGGRQLDTTISTIAALPEIARAVAGRVPLFIDGGFRRGTDILKALALGADGVFLGRPVLWALAASGQAGVVQAVNIVTEELHMAMQLAGCASIAQARKDAASLLRR